MSLFKTYLESKENADIKEVMRLLRKLKKETIEGKKPYSLNEYEKLQAFIMHDMGIISKDKLK